MKDKTTIGRSQDRSRVAGGEGYEVNYEKEIGVGADKVKDAVDEAGNSRKKIEKKLRK